MLDEVRCFSKFKLRLRSLSLRKTCEFSGLCVLFNLKFSRFLLNESAQLLYQVHFSLSTVFLTIFWILLNFCCILQQLLYSITFNKNCQPFFKLFLINFWVICKSSVLNIHSSLQHVKHFFKLSYIIYKPYDEVPVYHKKYPVW